MLKKGILMNCFIHKVVQIVRHVWCMPKFMCLGPRSRPQHLTRSRPQHPAQPINRPRTSACAPSTYFCVLFFWLVFRKKDLYLVITQKLTFMKSGGFHEIRQISWGRFHEIWWIKSSGFHEIWQISCEIHLQKLINQIFQEKLFSFMECCGKAMSCFHMKSAGFRKDQLPGMVSPMFIKFYDTTTL